MEWKTEEKHRYATLGHSWQCTSPLHLNPLNSALLEWGTILLGASMARRPTHCLENSTIFSCSIQDLTHIESNNFLPNYFVFTNPTKINRESTQIHQEWNSFVRLSPQELNNTSLLLNEAKTSRIQINQPQEWIYNG